MSWFLDNPPDFSAHSAEVAAVWKAYREGRPTRVPVSIHGSVRNLIQNPELNDTGYTFEDFFTDPEAQIQCQLAYQDWYRHHVVCDREMGPPKEGWTLTWKRNLHRPDEEFAVEKKIKWVLTSAISLINVLPAPALHGVR